jgi:hypothetical protein
MIKDEDEVASALTVDLSAGNSSIASFNVRDIMSFDGRGEFSKLVSNDS